MGTSGLNNQAWQFIIVRESGTKVACIQDMLLATHSLGLGGVWLGEILENKEKVNKVHEAPDSFELMAVVALGHPVDTKRIPERKELDQLIFRRNFEKAGKAYCFYSIDIV